MERYVHDRSRIGLCREQVRLESHPFCSPLTFVSVVPPLIFVSQGDAVMLVKSISVKNERLYYVVYFSSLGSLSIKIIMLFRKMRKHILLFQIHTLHSSNISMHQQKGFVIIFQKERYIHFLVSSMFPSRVVGSDDWQ